MRLLELNPFHEAVGIQKLSGRKNLYRLRLTIHARLVMEIIISPKTVTPVDIDTRENIY